jgi:uncharacterized membrane protein
MENEVPHTDQNIPVTPHVSASGEQTTPTASERNTVMAILAYLSILVIIPLLVAKDDPFVKFHVKQGLILAIIGLVISALSMSMMIWIFFPVIGIINIALLVLSIIGIVNVIQGKEQKLPLVGHLADNFTF